MTDKTKLVINNAEQKMQKSISNLKVENNKFYNLVKSDTKLVLNTIGHGFVAVCALSFALTAKNFIFLLASGYVIVKTILHAKKTNTEILNEKKLIK